MNIRRLASRVLPVARLKASAKRLPAIAWRDEKLRLYRAHNKVLQAEITRLGGRIPARDSIAIEDTARVNRLSSAVQARKVRASDLFDEQWYRRQLDARGIRADATVEHYVTRGYRMGLSAGPAFVESWYKSQAGVGKLGVAPLVHYLTLGQRVSPHPSFPAAEYVEQNPTSTRHEGGPLGHYLAGHGTAPGLPSPEEFLTRARAAAEHVLSTRGFEDFPRMSATFDEEAEARFKAELRADDSLLADRPVVSVILPTKDRAEALVAALDSVLAQTYPAWELVVVDDGSTDGTPELLDAYTARDPRLRVVRHDVNRGVAAARNSGIEVATGSYLAYLDSDNTWRPDFLEIMVRFMRRERCSVAYGASALVEVGGQERRQYRAQPFSREALRERNYIDCIVVVHERALLERTGAFDETLRRTVDWDLLIRLADVADFHFAPFIATEYDLWEEGTDRISTDEAEGYRFRVRERTLVDWDRARHELGDRGSHATAVIPVMSGAERAITTVRRVLDVSTPDLDVVLVDCHMRDGESVALHVAFADEPRVRVHRLTQALTPELARNVGATLARGSHLLFLPDDAWVFAGWDSRLVAALDEHAVVQPLVLDQFGVVWSAGVSFADGSGRRRWTGLATDAPEVRGTRVVDGVSAVCAAVRAADFVAVEGFDPLFIRHDSGAELALRIRTARNDGVPGTAAVVGSAVVAFSDERSDQARNLAHLTFQLQNARSQEDAWERTGLTAVPPDDADEMRVTGYRHAGPKSVEPQPVYTRRRGRLRWSIKIGPQLAWERENWGDWHFALALRESLEALGHDVTIDGREAWYRPTAHLDDVVLVLQGRGRYRPSPHQLNLLWVISHPAAAPVADVREYDLVFGASERWCAAAARHARRTPELLLQCTDPRRFRPSEPDPSYAHDVLVVANARGMRPIVGDALAAGALPDVYGVNWHGLLPDGAWKGTYLPNEELPLHYGSSRVVLNDHWAEMREWGLVSNRLFDAVACGTPVISDHLPEIAPIFGDTVLTYRSVDELREHLDHLLSVGGDDRARRLAAAEMIHREHSFDARAATLSARVDAAVHARERRAD